MKAVNRTSTRNDAIELLRYVCSVGIVWFHMGGPYAWIGYASLIVFVILTVNFALAQGGTSWSRTRVLKLWMFWSVIYASLKVAQSLVHHQPISAEFHWWMLSTGPALPLWFLPFIYVARGAATTYNKATLGKFHWAEVFLLPALTLACLALIPLSPGVPFSQWLIGASGCFMAISVFRTRQEPRYLIVMTVALVVGMIAGVGHEAKMLLFALLVAAGAIFCAPVLKSKPAAYFGAISLGVYVLHPAVSAILHGTLASYSTTVQISVVVLFSTILAMVLKRTPVFGRFI